MGFSPQLTMLDSFEIKGVWYLPGMDAKSGGVNGTLKYNPKAIELELRGTFEDDDWNNEKIKEMIIYGYSNKGMYLSLFDCTISSKSIMASVFDTSSYIVNRFYAGNRHISNEYDPNFRKCKFSFTYLDAWMNYQVFQYENKVNKKRYSVTLDIMQTKKKLNTIEFNTPESCWLKEDIKWEITYPDNYYSKEATEVKVNRYFSLHSKYNKKLSAAVFRNKIYHLRSMITLFINTPIHNTYIDLYFPSTKKEFMPGDISKQNDMCRLYFSQVGKVEDRSKINSRKASTMFIRRSDIASSMGLIFNKWYNEQDKITEVINTYISDLYLPFYQEIKFLNTIRSIETFHRFYIKETIIDTIDNHEEIRIEKYKLNVIQYISDNIPNDDQDYFISRINHKDEQNLRTRLNDIMKQTPDKLILLLFGKLTSKQKSKLISSIVDTRNYFTHRDSPEKYKLWIDDHNLLWRIIKKLDILLLYHIFTMLGIDSDMVIQRLTSYSNHQYALHEGKV